jgi:hypothetical protein
LTEIGEQVLDDCKRLLQAANSLKLKCEHYASGAEVALRVARDDAIPEAVWRRCWGRCATSFPAPASRWCWPHRRSCRRWWRGVRGCRLRPHHRGAGAQRPQHRGAQPDPHPDGGGTKPPAGQPGSGYCSRI